MPSEKVNNLDPMAVPNDQAPRPPESSWRCRRTLYYPTDSQLRVYDIYTTKGTLGCRLG